MGRGWLQAVSTDGGCSVVDVYKDLGEWRLKLRRPVGGNVREELGLFAACCVIEDSAGLS